MNPELPNVLEVIMNNFEVKRVLEAPSGQPKDV